MEDKQQHPATDESIENLGDRMKAYEKSADTFLDPTLPFILRLDGHNFSKYTRHFTKPYDERISKTMIATATDLMVEFGASAAFTCSDEITLIFPAAVPKEGQEVEEPATEEEKKKLERRRELDPQTLIMYGGRIQKIVSLTAGYASSCFNHHIREQHYDPTAEAELLAHVTEVRKYFDSRAFNVPTNAEVFNNVFWRAAHDYRRNSIAGVAQHHLPKKSLHGQNTAQMLERLKTEKSIDWNECPDWYKWGTFIKKECYLLETETPQKVKVTAKRHRNVAKSFPLNGFDQQHVKFLLSKYLDETAASS